MILPTVTLQSGWLAARASSVSATGYELTKSDAPSTDGAQWMEAVVPGTVLTTLLKNNLIPDPFYGRNNEDILDISVAGREYYTFWFFNKFKVPKLLGRMRGWLQFRAVNYSAEVFLNGHGHVLPGGMFMRHNLDVTDWLVSGGENKLAVLVHPPDHPGRIPKEGGQGGDHDIAKDVAAQYVEGWDWIIPIRDRNTGIWDEVSMCFTGPVRLSDPYVVSTFDNGFRTAQLHATVNLENTSAGAVECTLKMQVTLDMDDGFCSVEHVVSEDVSIPSGKSRRHTINPLVFVEPKLWWPNGVGAQTLYQVDILVEVRDFGVSDSWSGRHGFRQIHSYIDPLNGGRKFEVNGEPLFVRGANWIVSDGLLRLSENRYRTDVRFHRDMNMNMIRVWGGALAERPQFYKACDEYGLLVWQEFWITGDCNGRGVSPSDHSWPLDHDLFLRCARDTVKLLRNYASLALWVGGNEQYPADDINETLKNELALHPAFDSTKCPVPKMSDSWASDPSQCLDGSRLYIQGSLWEGFAKGDGAFSDGPYDIQNPEDFFCDGFYPYAFNPEIGSVGVPSYATMKRTMPVEALDPPRLEKRPDGYILEVPNLTWDYHKFIPYADPDQKVEDQIALYGDARTIEGFCDKAQLANYVQYRALIESWNARMWTNYTGVLIWKSQNPWPGLRGQLYDHLLDQNGGFFGVQSAAEAIHVQLNLHTHLVQVVNTSRESLVDCSVHCEIWDLNGEFAYLYIFEKVCAQPWTTTDLHEISYHKLPNAKPVYFMLLKLLNHANEEVSRNFYWLHLPQGNYWLLEGAFRSKKIPLASSAVATVKHGECNLTVHLTNATRRSKPKHVFKGAVQAQSTEPEEKTAFNASSGDAEEPDSGVAFWLRLSVLSAEKSQGDLDRRILPTFYTDNYFSLVPGESRAVRITFAMPKHVGPELVLAIQGWNTQDTEIRFQV